MTMNAKHEYELLHQFEVIFRDGEHKTQAATRDYGKVWENVIDNPPEEGVTPMVVYRLNGTVCAVIAGLDELAENEDCAMEIARLASAMKREREIRTQLVAALEAAKKDRAYQKFSGGAHFTSAQTEYECKKESSDKAWKMVNAALAAAKGGEG